MKEPGTDDTGHQTGEDTGGKIPPAMANVDHLAMRRICQEVLDEIAQLITPCVLDGKVAANKHPRSFEQIASLATPDPIACVNSTTTFAAVTAAIMTWAPIITALYHEYVFRECSRACRAALSLIKLSLGKP